MERNTTHKPAKNAPRAVAFIAAAATVLLATALPGAALMPVAGSLTGSVPGAEITVDASIGTSAIAIKDAADAKARLVTGQAELVTAEARAEASGVLGKVSSTQASASAQAAVHHLRSACERLMPAAAGLEAYAAAEGLDNAFQVDVKAFQADLDDVCDTPASPEPQGFLKVMSSIWANLKGLF